MTVHSQKIGDSYVVHASRGWVDEEGFARDSSGIPLGVEDGCGHLNRTSMQARPAPAGALTIDTPLIALTSKWNYKFFHWIIENLSRLALVQGELAEGDARLLTTCKGGLAKESLAMFGISVHRVICWHHGRAYRTNRELLWPEPSPCGGLRHGAGQFLRRRALLPHLRPLVSRPNEGTPNSILLYQRHRHRILLEHEAVLKGLISEYGSSSVRIVDGSGSLRSQVEVYRAARCQVGPHGAGLAMMLFAPNDFGTAEITPGAYFVMVKRKSALYSHTQLNRNRNRTGRTVTSSAPNACFRGLAASLGQVHFWEIVGGATANENLRTDANAVLSLARKSCRSQMPTQS